ncbi:TIGR03089 family protein [Nocardiopsis sediminis]|uniref:TIGR03089 family protein n=1 Tax=Nocardiopsis sediminis TaxID=1778267 RepID=A0ABV8FLP5_9ACTN
MPAKTPGDLWRSAVAADPARPFVTAYDAAGGRVELSFATFDNWVAKTANMIVDGLAAEPGAKIALALPVHWQGFVWLIASWTAGLNVIPATVATLGEDDPDIVVTGPDGMDAALASGAEEVVATSLHPLGAPLPTCPPSVLDYTVEVRGYGDRFVPGAPVDPDAAALSSYPGTYSGADLAARAEDRFAKSELTSTDRVAIITDESEALAVLGSDLSDLLCPVAGGLPLVLSHERDSARLQSQLRMERVTAYVGLEDRFFEIPSGIRHLP